jgi:plastocyanin
MRATPLLLAGLILVSACGSGGGANGGGSAAPAAATVDMKNYAFTPTTVTIRAGQTVQWNFDDNGIAHNVIGDDGMHTADLATGSFRHTFKHSGTFNYQCSLHASMHGVVIVQ